MTTPKLTASPRISIIMALYNGAATLRRCLESVNAQTYRNIELIVIDGGSSDGSLEILEQYHATVDYWRSEADSGIYEAWNKGLDQVTGDWVHFLGADDYFPKPNVLGLVANALSQCSPGIRIVYGKEAIVAESGEILTVLGDSWEKICGGFMIGSISLPHTAAFHHLSLFENHGRFDASFRITGDYEFLLRELKYRPALFLRDIVVKGVTRSGVSKDWGRSLESVNEIARAKRMNGIFPYHPRWMLLVAKALIKDLLGGMVGPSRTRYVVDSYRRLTGRDPIWTKMR